MLEAVLRPVRVPVHHVGAVVHALVLFDLGLGGLSLEPGI